MANNDAATTSAQYLPDELVQLLHREMAGEMVPVDPYLASLEDVTCTADVECPICRVEAGEETPERFWDPEHPGEALTTKNEEFYDQTTFVTVPCCREKVRRGCLLHMWLDCNRLNPGIDITLKTRCFKCRQPVLDDEIDCGTAKLLERTYFLVWRSYVFQAPPTTQALPPGHRLDEFRLSLYVALCFHARLYRGDVWAEHELSQKIASAVQSRARSIDGLPFYCRGQIFGEMVAAVNQVVYAEFGQSVGDAVMSGKLDVNHHRFYSDTLSRALGLYTTSMWTWYWKPHPEVHDD